MALFNCFSKLVGRKKKVKDAIISSPDCENNNGTRTLQVKLENSLKPSDHDESKSTSFSVPVPFDIPEMSRCKVKLMNRESPVENETTEVAYEGEDEHDDKSPISRDNSDFNLNARDITTSNVSVENNDCDNKTSEKDATDEEEIDIVQSGHVSDPGMARKERWASPSLTRSCSNLYSREVLNKIADQLPPSKTQSFEELQDLANKVRGDVLMGSPCSQSSVLTHRSADKVMLKKHSSSQILPSKSKRLWWKLFLWSHRNLQKAEIAPKTRVSLLASVNQQGGYSSDTLEPSRVKPLSNVNSAGSFSELCSNKSSHEEDNGFKGGFSGLWPQNQWIAFSGESSSPFKRIDDWVKDLENQPSTLALEEENCNDQIVFPASPEADGSVAKIPTHSSRHNKTNLSEELLHANSVIQSLNSSSTVAHISGMGLKAIPIISHFSSLRSINLSNNSIGMDSYQNHFFLFIFLF